MAQKINVPIIWVLGGPGSGKGTQCDKMVAKYGLTHLSSGDLLRNEVSSGSSRGKELSAVMERGELVSKQIVLDLLKEAMFKSLPNSKGFLIDGYPREKEQGVLFEQQIGAATLVLFIDAAEETLVKRLLGRALTSGRADDNEETIKKRIHTFNSNNDEIVNAYKNKLKRINSEPAPDVVFKEIEKHLDPIFLSKL
ncbi:hypothetical protein RN001_008100 [Aquatica leii]|uniref:adenylate kinase n=1 Tax=Aquatica leii TaxID=1421715 RepID=A0AAN7P9W0_9COLE|nr:hypothetical protein RN001_008100 [Aquatica leii]